MPAPGVRLVRATAPAMPEIDNLPLTFADENARIAWDIGQRVKQIAPSMPPESADMDASAIRFAPEHEPAGVYAVLFSGTMVGTADPRILVVPQRTLKILDHLHIPYERV